MKWLYTYPKREYPYSDMQTSQRRSPTESEYELLDSAVFAEDRYFVFVEYAKGIAQGRMRRHHDGQQA